MSTVHKIIAIIAAAIIFLVGGFFALNSYIYSEKQADQPPENGMQDYKNLTYIIDRDPITLVDGVSEIYDAPAPGLESTLTTKYLGFTVEGDINEDGLADVAFILTQEGSSDEVRYYLAAAIRENDGLTGTNAVLIGDRITINETQIKNGTVVVEYLGRAPGESADILPTRAMSRTFAVSGTELIPVSS